MKSQEVTAHQVELLPLAWVVDWSLQIPKRDHVNRLGQQGHQLEVIHYQMQPL